MKFHLTGTPNDISADSLVVTAETPAEVMEVWQHYRLDSGTPEGVLKMAEAIQAGRYIHTTQPHPTRKWFDVDVYLNRALNPYWALLKRMTGFDVGVNPESSFPDTNLTSLYPNRLGFTHITDSIAIEDGAIHAHVYIQAQDWNNRDAATNVQRNADDYVMEQVGKRKHEREFITAGNGHMVANKNYLKRHQAEPGLGAPWLWTVVFAWWRANHATEGQRRLLDAIDALKSRAGDRDYDIRKGGGEEATLVGYSMYALDPAGKVDWDGKGTKASVYTWEQFQAVAC